MIVTQLEYPFGLRCYKCNKELSPGMEYREISLGGDWVTAVCPECGDNK